MLPCWILGKRHSEKRLRGSGVLSLTGIPVSRSPPPLLIKQRKLISESLLQFTLISSCVMWHLRKNSMHSIVAVALHLYWLFPLYLHWDMSVTSFHCEKIILLSLPLILLLLLLLPLRFRILSLLEQMNYSNFSSSKSSIFRGALRHRIIVGHRCESWQFRGALRFSFSILLSQESIPYVCSQNSNLSPLNISAIYQKYAFF